MKRFKKILVVHEDGVEGQSTLSRAVSLAIHNQAQLTLIRVIDRIPPDYRMLVTSLSPEEIMQMVIKEHVRLLEQYVSSFTCTIEVRVVAGREFLEIIQEVLRNNHDIVIKTARGMSGTMSMLFGSTALHLLRKCPCPVWLIKPGAEQSFRRILAAVDVVPLEIEENNLNRKIIEMASSLARSEKSFLHIIHAREKPDTSFIPANLDYFSNDIGSLANESINMHIRWLDDFLNEFDLEGTRYEEHVISGWAEEVIEQFAEQNQVDLIVMGTVCRTGIPGFFIGNTAEKILHKINCSVLAVKPDGFISPVQLNDK